jgi:hypothetical protein
MAINGNCSQIILRALIADFSIPPAIGIIGELTACQPDDGVENRKSKRILFQVARMRCWTGCRKLGVQAHGAKQE